jgi:alanyl-tRNA synthetase
VVEAVIDRMGGTYSELLAKRQYIVRNTRAEEERFLATIDAGMKRFDEIAPVGGSGVIQGKDAFRLYDTFGFPVDLTELMAQERGSSIDLEGFEEELEAQRRRSREDRAASGIAVEADALADGWETVGDAAGAEQEFAAYRATALETDILAYRWMDDGRIALQLRENPFYAESGGQISDSGHVHGDKWTMRVNEVRKVGGRVAVVGVAEGDFSAGHVRAEVEEGTRRDTERNHTATHLLHAALRRVLGEHVHQMGSLVAPDRLRFDFSHNGPLTPDELARIASIASRVPGPTY